MSFLPLQRFQRVQCLTTAQIFCDLSSEEIAALSSRAPIRHLEPKTLIYTPEHPIEMVFMVNEGRIHLYQLGTDGKRVTNALLESGTLFGEMMLLGQSMNGHFAETVTACVLCVMTVTDVRDLLLSDVRISNRLVYLLGKRLLDTQRQLSVVTLKPVPQRIAWTLVYLTDESGTQTLPITHDVIASLVGATRETVTKVLNDFQSKYLITLGRGNINVLDAQTLVQLMES
jgi:CRP/FNR family transcriptional regulator, cyclic AMP receptor protein